MLLPTLKEGQVVIMDNCSIHKSPKVRELIESKGRKLMFLPPYSADFNPLENYWAVIKIPFKKIKHKFNNIVDAICKTLKNDKWSFYS